MAGDRASVYGATGGWGRIEQGPKPSDGTPSLLKSDGIELVWTGSAVSDGLNPCDSVTALFSEISIGLVGSFAKQAARGR